MREDEFSVNLPVVKNKEELGFAFQPHPDIVDLLWIENGPYKNWYGNPNCQEYEFMGMIIRIVFGEDEPSLINPDLLISIDNLNDLEPPEYYPSYKSMNPQQRAVYWKFLNNPYSGNYDISYVFVLYYGLERHLYQGKYDKAVEVIMKLRKIYNVSSFQSYSTNAIVLTALAHRRDDLIVRLFNERNEDIDNALSPDLFLLCKLALQEPLTAKELMVFSRVFGFTNKNYIKKYPDIFEGFLSERLTKNPLMVSDYITEIVFSNLDKVKVSLFANYSIKNNWIDIPAISSHAELREKWCSLLKEAHENVKVYLKEQRALGNIVQEAPKKERKQKEFDEKMEQLLLNNLEMSTGYIDKHYALMGLHEFYYKYRELSLDYIRLAEKYAQEDIIILPQVQYTYKIEQEQNNICYLSSDTAIDKSGDEEPYEKFRYIIPAFKRLAIIYEQEGRNKEAIEICNKAIDFYTEVEYKEEVESFRKRKNKIAKK